MSLTLFSVNPMLIKEISVPIRQQRAPGNQAIIMRLRDALRRNRATAAIKVTKARISKTEAATASRSLDVAVDMVARRITIAVVISLVVQESAVMVRKMSVDRSRY